MQSLLEVKNLKTYFYTDDGVVPSVDGVDFVVYEGETLGIVGESGSGKSVTSLSIMRLLPSRSGKIVSGEIIFRNQNLIDFSQKKMRSVRGNDIAMIFQEPMTSLNPVFKIGDQLCETLRLHLSINGKEAKQRSIDLLKQVGMPRPEKVVGEYPHQLSGGMRQRVMIAMAMSCHPGLLIADEPTTALDVTIQAQILDLMRDIKSKNNTSIILITHDLGVVYEMCDRVIVMYAGKVVEDTNVKTLFSGPKHPYTIGLLESIPKISNRLKRLHTIPGNVPSPKELPKGCSFAPRCLQATGRCYEFMPGLEQIDSKGVHKVRCWLYSNAENKVSD